MSLWYQQHCNELTRQCSTRFCLVVQQRLGVRDTPNPARAASALAQRWQPWRSYAVLRLWHTKET